MKVAVASGKGGTGKTSVSASLALLLTGAGHRMVLADTAVVIAGGMGPRAVQLFGHHGVEVVLGVPQAPPEELAGALVRGKLRPEGNSCDHDSHGGGCREH